MQSIIDIVYLVIHLEADKTFVVDALIMRSRSAHSMKTNHKQLIDCWEVNMKRGASLRYIYGIFT